MFNYISIVVLCFVSHFSFATNDATIKILSKERGGKIEIKIDNNDSVGLYFNVQVEKYSCSLNEFLLYSSDAFFSSKKHPLVLTLHIPPNEFRIFKIVIDEGEWLYLDGNNEGNNNGLFRLKLKFGINKFNFYRQQQENPETD